MPRTGPRRSLTTAAALLAMLAAPAAAQAATYTVKPTGGPCGAADLECGSLAEAATAAAAGDVFNVEPGTYSSATFSVAGVTLVGTVPGKVLVDGTLTFSAATGAPSKLAALVIGRTSGSEPGVAVTGAAGLEIADSIVVNPNGHGVRFAEGANKIVRSTIFTGGAATSAVFVLSGDASSAAKTVTLESTLVAGGAAGVTVQTGETGLLTSTAGNVTLNLRHVTAAGSTNSLVLNSSKATAPLLSAGVGSITVDVADSLLDKPTSKTPYDGLAPLLNKNTITDTYTRTLREFDAATVFQDPAKRKYHLKAGSPAINAGGVTPGESATDFDGNDRSAAPTDQGADEYTEPPPPPPPPPAGPPAPGTPGATDGVAPKIVITKPTANQKIKLTTRTTKTTTVTKNGKKVKVKKTTIKKNKIPGFAGTATDPSGIRGVVVSVQKLSSGTDAPATTPLTATSKCKWLNLSKGIVSKLCVKPVLLLANTAKDGSWTLNLKSTLKLSAGTYRIIAVGVDNSGAKGNSAPTGDAIHRFTLLK